jgi:hypothetical protein
MVQVIKLSPKNETQGVLDGLGVEKDHIPKGES